ncbi:hypothetical protein F443_22946, partial [Phytophthora nicotianae P1569]
MLISSNVKAIITEYIWCLYVDGMLISSNVKAIITSVNAGRRLLSVCFSRHVVATLGALKLQKTSTLSSTQASYMSPSDYEEEEMWMRVELEDIESEQDAGAITYEGDEALAKGTGYQAHTKHITLLLHLRTRKSRQKERGNQDAPSTGSPATLPRNDAICRRTEDAYWDMANFVVQATDQLLELALRRVMKRYAITDEECLIAMTRGVLDTLTVIDHEQVERGIKWVKREIKKRCILAKTEYTTAKWEEFWGYFERTWLDQYTIDVWNVFGLDNEL